MKHSTIYAILIGACACVGNIAHAQTFTTLYNFCVGKCRYGTEPNDGLVQGTDGNLYGTTYLGGSTGDGTVFKITPAGMLTRLRSFCRLDGCADGFLSRSGLLLVKNGDWYGVTAAGGATEYGGTVFKITSSGRLTTLYSFCVQSGCPDGEDSSALMEAEDGNLYGTTSEGGANDHGTAFKINREGTLTTLHRFCEESGCVDGDTPEGGLVQARDGNLYGTTAYGGANNGGIVFKMTKEGIVTTVYAFCSASGCRDGSRPQATLTRAADGDLFGTTILGGTYNGGTVFKISPSSGKFTELFSFCSRSEVNCVESGLPVGALVQATDENLYGTTSGGGTNNDGAIFKITPGGTLTTVYSFNEGVYPGELVQATDGNLYGTSSVGGEHGGGFVFSLSVGLGPFVKTLPTFGKTGAAVTILGTDLTGATSVSFNGVAANFTVISASEIETALPAGATTGAIKVTTPSGTLSSNVVFHVSE